MNQQTKGERCNERCPDCGGESWIDPTDETRAVCGNWPECERSVMGKGWKRAQAQSAPSAPKQSKPVAYLKEWIFDGENRKRVDLHEKCEVWMGSLDVKVTPLVPAAENADLRKEMERTAQSLETHADNPSTPLNLRVALRTNAECLRRALGKGEA